MIRIGIDDLPIDPLGLRQATGLMMGEGNVERFGNGGQGRMAFVGTDRASAYGAAIHADQSLAAAGGISPGKHPNLPLRPHLRNPHICTAREMPRSSSPPQWGGEVR